MVMMTRLHKVHFNKVTQKIEVIHDLEGPNLGKHFKAISIAIFRTSLFYSLLGVVREKDLS